MIRPDIILRMRQNRYHASCKAIACVYAGTIAQDYTDLVREAMGASEEDLRALAAASVERGDRVLYNFACHVFAASGYQRRAA